MGDTDGVIESEAKVDPMTKLEEINQDIPQSDDIEKELANDLKTFLSVDVTSKTDDIDALISGLLAKLEEFCTVMEMIRTESKEIFFTIAPLLHERCEEMKPLFQKIDQLEKFVAVVQSSVDDAEQKVSLAEKEVGSKKIKKILRNVPVPKFLLRKKDIQSYMKSDVTSHDLQALKRFKTEEYFEPYTISDEKNEDDEYC